MLIKVLPEVFELRVTAHTNEQREAWVKNFTKLLTEMNGGATITEQEGTWVSSHTIVQERSTLLTVNSNDAWGVYQRVKAMMKAYLRIARQEAVWFRINELVFVADYEGITYAVSEADRVKSQFT